VRNDNEKRGNSKNRLVGAEAALAHFEAHGGDGQRRVVSVFYNDIDRGGVLQIGADGGFVGLLVVAGDGGAVVAKVDVWFVTGDALAGDAGALEAADEFFGLAGEHGACDDFDSTWGGHPAMVAGFAVDFPAEIPADFG
jgi:hypothetical protein